jgi:hypothetical protein
MLLTTDLPKELETGGYEALQKTPYARVFQASLGWEHPERVTKPRGGFHLTERTFSAYLAPERGMIPILVDPVAEETGTLLLINKPGWSQPGTTPSGTGVSVIAYGYSTTCLAKVEAGATAIYHREKYALDPKPNDPEWRLSWDGKKLTCIEMQRGRVKRTHTA